MNQQDDLESNYKAASNEQPSPELDQLILQAAVDALNDSPDQNEETEVLDNTNVIKGRFNIRRWQTPVSIAAAALFTVSFISTYDLWQLDEQDFLMEKSVQESFEPDKKKEQILNDETNIERRQKTLPMKRLRKVQSAYDSDDSNNTIVVTGSRIAQEKTLSAFKLDSISDSQSAITVDMNAASSLAESESLAMPKTLTSSVEAEEKIKLKSDTLLLTIAMWLEQIEIAVEKDKFENAKAEIVILLKQHPLSTFTKHQRDRFDEINNKIRLAQNTEPKQ